MTLVEILVTLGIFAISFGLLLPAIQQARESARFRQCQNHLRQVGLATVAHEAARSQLPAGTLGYAAAINRDDFRHRPTGPYWRKVPHTSFWVQLLPYLNQEIQSAKLHPALTRRGESLHNARNQDGALVNWFGQADGLAELSTRSIDVLHCPSDSLRDQTTPIRLAGGSQPVTNDGSNDRMDFLDDVGSQMTGALVASNYLACAGAHSGGIPADPQRLHFRGAMSSGETMVLSKITDGTSNSLLAGETIGRWRYGVRQRMQLWTVGGLARMRGDVPWMSELDQLVNPTRIMLGTPLEASEVGFGAMHPTGVAFVMVDGSTHAISRETDWQVLYQLAGIAASQTPF